MGLLYHRHVLNINDQVKTFRYIKIIMICMQLTRSSERVFLCTMKHKHNGCKGIGFTAIILSLDVSYFTAITALVN